MSEKVPVSFRAALARFTRHIAKDGEKLVKFRTPMDGLWDYAIVDTVSNVVKLKGDHSNLLAWMAESGAIKPYEEVEGSEPEQVAESAVEPVVQANEDESRLYSEGSSLAALVLASRAIVAISQISKNDPNAVTAIEDIQTALDKQLRAITGKPATDTAEGEAA